VGHKFTQPYLDDLFSADDLTKLVDIQCYLAASPAYNSGAATYGHPEPVFAFMEGLLWFSQALRSGVWTYYEATPRFRQDAMVRALERYAPQGFAAYYALGMKDWRDESKIVVVDKWIENHEDDCDRWLWRLANEHRPTFERACGQTDA
jgi:hypothetical protein